MSSVGQYPFANRTWKTKKEKVSERSHCKRLSEIWSSGPGIGPKLDQTDSHVVVNSRGKGKEEMQDFLGQERRLEGNRKTGGKKETFRPGNEDG